VEFAPAYSTVA